MAKSTVLKRDMNGSPTIYLLFVPHLFIHLHCNKPIKELYNISGRHTQVLELFAGGVHGGIEPALDRDL